MLPIAEIRDAIFRYYALLNYPRRFLADELADDASEGEREREKQRRLLRFLVRISISTETMYLHSTK